MGEVVIKRGKPLKIGQSDVKRLQNFCTPHQILAFQSYRLVLLYARRLLIIFCGPEVLVIAELVKPINSFCNAITLLSQTPAKAENFK